ncbi:MAG TPA: ABC transporter ATP-binding protein [Polyangiaceae bacterium]|nr:ABC transporter ATP-binding protein [Polyangiaceae bacterium]
MSEAAIQCSGLVKCYGQLRAVDGIDLTVQRGQCFGLLGPNGAGKTTTVEMLEGLTPPTSGKVLLFGTEWRADTAHALRERLGVQLQETVLADKLMVEEVLLLFRSFYSKGRSVEEALGLLSLQSCRRQRYCELSGGQKQRVAVATALVGLPDLLFLDEPTTGLDPRARQQLWEVIRGFRADGGTVVLTTHYMEEAAALCDELAVIDQGKIITQGTPRALTDSLGNVQFLEFDVDGQLDVSSLRQLDVVHSVQQLRARCRVELDRSLGALAKVIDVLDRTGIVPIGLSAHQATLDDVFLQLTGHRLEQDQTAAEGNHHSAGQDE